MEGELEHQVSAYEPKSIKTRLLVLLDKLSDVIHWVVSALAISMGISAQGFFSTLRVVKEKHFSVYGAV